MTESLDWTPVADLPRALGGAPLQGRLRAAAEDFQVSEILGFEPDGEGDHALLLVRKTSLNTDDVARKLARHAGAKPVDVGYCGLKDRNAVTRQWFSVNLAGREEPDWDALGDECLSVEQVVRHRRKLKRGTARGNRFRLRLTEIAGDLEAAELCLNRIRQSGVPNYFGEQRFGRDYGNIRKAERLFSGEIRKLRPHLRGLYLSAVRSQLFNELLALRVEDASWDHPRPGDLMALEGSRSWFAAEEADGELLQRCAEMDIHPTGPLWGRGGGSASAAVAELEAGLAERFPQWCEGLERMGLRQERRPLRMRVANLTWDWEANALILEFSLGSGCYATSVMRELMIEPADSE